MTLASVIIVTGLLFMMSISFGEASEEGTLEDNNVMYTEIDNEDMYDIKRGEGAGFVLPDFTQNTNIKFDFILNGFLSSGVFLIFSGIFATNTVCNQYHCGFQKNLSIYSGKKWQLVIAKNIAVLAFSVVEIFLIVLTLLLLCRGYLNHFTLGNAANIIKYVAMQALLHYAFGSFAMCLAELIRSKVAGITLTCLLSLGLGNLLFHKLDELLKLKKFSITEHTLVYHVKLLPMTFDGKQWGTAAAVAIFALLLYNGISALVISKRDMA